MDLNGTNNNICCMQDDSWYMDSGVSKHVCMHLVSHRIIYVSMVRIDSMQVDANVSWAWNQMLKLELTHNLTNGTPQCYNISTNSLYTIYSRSLMHMAGNGAIMVSKQDYHVIYKKRNYKLLKRSIIMVIQIRGKYYYMFFW